MPPRKDAAIGGGLVVALLGGVPGPPVRRGRPRKMARISAKAKPGRGSSSADGARSPAGACGGRRVGESNPGRQRAGGGDWPGRKRRNPPTVAGGLALPSGGQTVSTSVGSETSATVATLVIMLASTRASISRTSPVVTRGNGASHSGRLRGLLLTGARVLMPTP